MAMRPRQKKRLGQTDWLALAMDVVAKEGGAKLTIDSLCRKLGVTKGSFYAHFESRADFVRQIVAYWRENFTQSVVDAIDELEDATAEARLLALMQLLHRERMAGYEVAVRALRGPGGTDCPGISDTLYRRTVRLDGANRAEHSGATHLYHIPWRRVLDSSRDHHRCA